MALTIETGTGTDQSANSYITITELTDFLSARNLSVTAGTEEALILRATDILEQQNYKGVKQTPDQPLSFPRSKIADKENVRYRESTIPKELKTATIYLAWYLEKNPKFSDISGPMIKKKVISSISTEFATGEGAVIKKTTIKDLPLVINEIKHLLAVGTSGGRVYRG